MLRHNRGGCRPWQKVLSLSCMEQAASYCARAVTRTSSKKPSTPVLKRFKIAVNDLSCVRLYCRSLPCGEALSVEQVDLLALMHLGVKHATFRYCDFAPLSSVLHCWPKGEQISCACDREMPQKENASHRHAMRQLVRHNSLLLKSVQTLLSHAMP